MAEPKIIDTIYVGDNGVNKASIDVADDRSVVVEVPSEHSRTGAFQRMHMDLIQFKTLIDAAHQAYTRSKGVLVVGSRVRVDGRVAMALNIKETVGEVVVIKRGFGDDRLPIQVRLSTDGKDAYWWFRDEELEVIL